MLKALSAFGRSRRAATAAEVVAKKQKSYSRNAEHDGPHQAYERHEGKRSKATLKDVWDAPG